MLRLCYLNIVQIGRGSGSAGARTTRSYEMSILMNRILDVVVTYAVLGLTLTVAGATVALGA